MIELKKKNRLTKLQDLIGLDPSACVRSVYCFKIEGKETSNRQTRQRDSSLYDRKAAGRDIKVNKFSTFFFLVLPCFHIFSLFFYDGTIDGDDDRDRIAHTHTQLDISSLFCLAFL